MYKVYLIRRLKVRKKKSEILNIIKEEIISNYKSYILVIILFSVGLFLGVLFINQTENQENVIKYINTYIDEIKISESNSTIVQLKTDIKNNIFLVFILWFAGTTIVGIPIVFGIIIARGFCLGYTISACVITLGKIKGLIFVLLTIFLQNLILIPALLFLGVSSIKLYKSIVKDRRKENIKVSILKHSIVSIFILIILIISSLIKIEISYRLILLFAKYF
ncbi:MAG TPA: hypothetical protein DIU30_05560 [Clostridiales bacterium]|jgi:stage II sporulation protein M|nr:hypothetical protein [Clostridiales bacterium]